MNKHSRISISIAVLSTAVLLGACGASGGNDAATTSTSVLADGSVEVFEVNDQGEITGTVPASGAEGATDGEGASSAEGSSDGDGTDPAPSSGDGSAEADAAPANADDPGDTGDAGDDQADPSAPGPDPAPAPEAEPDAEPAPAEAATAPKVAVTRQTCNGANLIVSITANAGNGYRKGIKSVTVARQNEYDVFLTSNASWLGPETGAANVWNGTLGGNRQNIGKVLKVTATSDAGQSTTTEVPITAPC